MTQRLSAPASSASRPIFVRPISRGLALLLGICTPIFNGGTSVSSTCRLLPQAEMPFYSSHGWWEFLSLLILLAWYVSPQSTERQHMAKNIAVGGEVPGFRTTRTNTESLSICAASLPKVP